MIEEMKTRQTAAETRTVAESGQRAPAGGGRSGAERETPKFNRYLYENFLCHIEGQIEFWNRSAARDANPETAHALWHKAEGLGYAVRLLYAFKPEFEDLVESAEKSKQAALRAQDRPQ